MQGQYFNRELIAQAAGGVLNGEKPVLSVRLIAGDGFGPFDAEQTGADLQIADSLPNSASEVDGRL